MVVYRMIRATVNEAEFFSHGLSKSQVRSTRRTGLDPFFYPEALLMDLDLSSRSARRDSRQQ